MNLMPRRAPSRRLPLALAAALLLAVIWATLALRPGTVTLNGESESESAEFSLSARRYALSADLLPGCQYTFYLTPKGQLWNRAGRAIASASGETGLSLQTDPLRAGRYTLHGYTSPEEGCSWTLRLKPR